MTKTLLLTVCNSWCVMICTALIEVASTKVAELVMNFWNTRVTGSIGRCPGHVSRHPGLHSLATKTDGPGPETSRHDHSPQHKFVRHPGLGDLAPVCMADPEAEVAHGCERHRPIRRILTTGNWTRELWSMLRVSRQSCGNGECSWS